MKLKEENKALKNLVLTLNAYIPHRCYNCTYFERVGLEIGLNNVGSCLKHDIAVNENDGCHYFKLVNGIYEKAERLGIEL